MLEKYREKRDFTKTAEPTGKKAITHNKELSFVVHKHQAQNLHYDFRLEHDGVLASWAIPKGVPTVIGEKRLAVQVEDHPFKYRNFEGSISEGQYGAGQVEIWDKGTYRPIKWDDKVVEVVLMGKIMKGRYSLVKTSGYARNSWLLIKNKPKDNK
jgi:bifunctional non-homologous end joining protein LigD